MRNYYRVLGIPESSSGKQIKEAYRKLAIEYHPDKNPGSLNAGEMIKMINEAYAVLSNPAERSAYDRKNNISQRGGLKKYSPKPKPSTKDLETFDPDQEIDDNWTPPSVGKTAISLLIQRILIADCIVSGILFLWFKVNPSARPNYSIPSLVREAASVGRGGSASWVENFTMAVYLQIAIGLYAIYVLAMKKEFRFLYPFIWGKSYVFILLASAVIGLTTIHSTYIFPAIVLLWVGFVIVCIGLYYMERKIGGTF